MQKIQGFAEAGNTTLVISGAAGTIARKVQGSFPSATITVFNAGTVTLTTIYADNAGTAKANPFTAAADGTWFFYAPNGAYDVQFSGGTIPTPFTLGAIGAFDESILLIDVTSEPFLAKGDGSTDNASAIAAAWAAVQARGGGILFFPQGTFKTSGSIAPATGCVIQGSGQGSTVVSYIGSGYWLDLGPTSVANRFTWRDMQVTCSNVSIGGLRVGSPDTDFADNNFRIGWSLQNIFISGPGASIAGTIGMSVTQLIDHCISNLLVFNFESSAIIDKCGNGTWTRARFQSFKNGPLISLKAGTGAAANGASQDVFINPEFLGPTFGAGDTVTVQHQWITFINALYEAQNGGTPNALLHLASRGLAFGDSAHFMDINGLFSFGNLATHTISFDTGFIDPKFIGTSVPIAGYASLLLGTPYNAAEASIKFKDVTSELAALVVAADPNGLKTHLDAPVNPGINNYRRQTVIADQTGLFRILKGPAGQTIPATGVGWETFYQQEGDQAITNIIDRATTTFKVWLIQPSGLVVAPSGLSNALSVNSLGIQVGIGVQPPATHVGIQHKRVTTGSIGASATAVIAMTWAVPFDNANYTPVVSLVEGTATNNLTIQKLDGFDANGVSVRVTNNDSGGAHTGTLLFMAMHD